METLNCGLDNESIKDSDLLSENCETCSDCGEVIEYGDYYTIDNKKVCDDCYCDNYFTCLHCEDIFPKEKAQCIGNRYFCSNCAEDYEECVECGTAFNTQRYGRYCDYCENWYCDDCSCDCEECNSERKPQQEPIRGNKGKIVTIDNFIGVEIEAEGFNGSEIYDDLPSCCGYSQDGSL